MRKLIGYIALSAALGACPAASFAQGATTGISGTVVGTPSPSSTLPNANRSGTTGGMAQPYTNAPTTNPGTLQPGLGSGGSPSSVSGTAGGRLNGSTAGAGSNTSSAGAGGSCGLSLSDPTSGSLTPLTQPLSPGSAAGGCE
jgi:hypothetical protein